MLPKLVAASEERGFHFAFRTCEACGDGGNGIQIPVSADEDVPLFFVQHAKEPVDGFAERHIVDPAFYIIWGWDALLHLRAELADKCLAFQAAALTAAIQGNVAGNPRQGWRSMPPYRCRFRILRQSADR